MSNYNIPELPLGYELETKTVLKQVNLAGRKLAELKGVARIWVENRLLGDISTIDKLLLQMKEGKDKEKMLCTLSGKNKCRVFSENCYLCKHNDIFSQNKQ